ncbi:MAG: DUF4145 domain-containing protein [Terracidiphilus sp.]
MHYLLECPFCKATMGVDVKAAEIDPPEEPFPFSSRVSLCVCPGCRSVLIGCETEADSDGVFDKPVRVWPSPPLYLSYKIPPEIKRSLEEAERCLKGRAYTACVAMCGRALEAVGRHFYPQNEPGKPRLMLKDALDKLAEGQVIDARLHKWGLALHSDRNLAAHPSGTEFKEQDAKDVLKFARNICEYVFVLSSEFDDFERRRKVRTASKK